jgi:hypothetical protein
MTNDDIEKIKLVDQVLSSLSLDEIKSMLSADLIVDKLKGNQNSTGMILSALQSLAMLQVEIMTLRTDHIQLKEDFKAALKVTHQMRMAMTPYSTEFETLKSKYSVY